MKEKSDGLRKGRKPFREKDMQGSNNCQSFQTNISPSCRVIIIKINKAL
jgi:hypothetical protein